MGTWGRAASFTFFAAGPRAPLRVGWRNVHLLYSTGGMPNHDLPDATVAEVLAPAPRAASVAGTIPAPVSVSAEVAESAPQGLGAVGPGGADQVLEDGAAAMGDRAAPGATGAGDSAPASARSGLKVVARGFTWAFAGQVVGTAGNLALTPFVIHGLGLQRYGLFAVTTMVASFVGSLAGGLPGTAQRYFPMYAGADDRLATTRLLTTLIALILGAGMVLSVLDWFVSPLIVDSLSMSHNLRPETLFLFRTLGVLVTFGWMHSVIASVVNARRHFGLAVQVGLACYAVWVVGMIWVVHHHEGLRGVAVIFVVQQVLASAGIFPTACRYLTRQGLRIVPWAEMKELLNFSAKLQVTGTATLVNAQLNTFVLAAALSVRSVGIYNIGANFGDQLWGLAYNVLGPSAIQLGNTLGSDGPDRVYHQYLRMQRLWVEVTTGFCAVGMAASYFGVGAWLGRGYNLGSWVAVLCVAAALPLLFSGLLGVYVTTMKEVGLEMRFGLFSMASNVVFTAALVYFGVLGVAGSSIVSTFLSSLYLIRLVRRKMHPDLPNFFAFVPVVRALGCAAITVVLEVLLRPHLPSSGPIALLECAFPALAGLGVFAVLVVGVGPLAKMARAKRLPSLSDLLSTKTA